MLEWIPNVTVEAIVDLMLSRKIDAVKVFGDRNINRNMMLTDDRPVNEYFILRTIFGKKDPAF